MVRTLLIRGMLVGCVVGLRVFGFAKIFGEPQVDRAIAFETAMDAAKVKAGAAKGIHAMEESELVSRPMQASYGLLTGVMVYSTAFGRLFALAFAVANDGASVAVVAALLPPINEVPANFPAVVLWDFRVDSFSMQAIMWATLGLGFGALTESAAVNRKYRPNQPVNPSRQ